MKSDHHQKILITGAQGALGSQVVKKYLKEGFKVTGTFFHEISSIHQDPSENKNPDPLEVAKVPVEWLKVNLTDPWDIKTKLADRSFDLVVHCAGGFRYGKSDEMTDLDLNFLMQTNLYSAFYLVRELMPGMKKRNFGRIVFISSRVTLSPGLGMAAYAASKAGLNMLTQSLAEETKEFNITINAVLPTMIDTPQNRKEMTQADFSAWVTTEQLAEIIFTLTSPVGQAIHGALIPVSGRL